MKKSIDPWDISYQGKTLWCVYGPTSFPTIICCQLSVTASDNILNIWGYSVWKSEPGFRTLGISLSEFMKKFNKPVFFDNHANALKRIEKYTKPKI